MQVGGAVPNKGPYIRDFIAPFGPLNRMTVGRFRVGELRSHASRSMHRGLADRFRFKGFKTLRSILTVFEVRVVQPLVIQLVA